jgi:hypothetical protein
MGAAANALLTEPDQLLLAAAASLDDVTLGSVARGPAWLVAG